MSKECKKCGIVKPLSEYHKDRSKVDEKKTVCKACVKVAKDKWIKSNREKNKSNPDKEKYCSNCDTTKLAEEYTKNSGAKGGLNVHCIPCRAEYRSANKEHRNLMKIRWKKKNPHIVRWRRQLTSSLKRRGKIKTDSTEKMLGYNAMERWEYIENLFEPGMTWDNIHVDHIYPLSAFPIDTPESVVNALINLRPMFGIENTSKGAKITAEGIAVAKKLGIL